MIPDAMAGVAWIPNVAQSCVSWIVMIPDRPDRCPTPTDPRIHQKSPNTYAIQLRTYWEFWRIPGPVGVVHQSGRSEIIRIHETHDGDNICGLRHTHRRYRNRFSSNTYAIELRTYLAKSGSCSCGGCGVDRKCCPPHVSHGF